MFIDLLDLAKSETTLMTIPSTYFEGIERQILRLSKTGIISIHHLEILKCLNFENNENVIIDEFLKQKKLHEVMQIETPSIKTFADLTIFQFCDQGGRRYAALVYDSDELWQDPEVMEVYPI